MILFLMMMKIVGWRMGVEGKVKMLMDCNDDNLNNDCNDDVDNNEN